MSSMPAMGRQGQTFGQPDDGEADLVPEVRRLASPRAGRRKLPPAALVLAVAILVAFAGAGRPSPARAAADPGPAVPVTSVPTEDKVVALTFDAGSDAGKFQPGSPVFSSAGPWATVRSVSGDKVWLDHPLDYDQDVTRLLVVHQKDGSGNVLPVAGQGLRVLTTRTALREVN